ncbi:nlaXM [Symbiodinium necroappetens]|uniref:NlaXM protein n=1 Tax=Symbiodinium necroappetens TaxID=1628268 RepID=A0A812K7A2_9DINO|nr:nlaXM [Symbiodinium necroappetens]
MPEPLRVPNPARKLTVGSCCSGWCAELFACEMLSLDFLPVFGCDLLPSAQAVSEALFDHEFWFWDCMEEDFLQAPHVDLFLAGLPCQPWSRLGPSRGFEDDRGLLMLPVIRWMSARRPQVAIFEQVGSMLTRHPREFALFLELLLQIKHRGRPAYIVTYETLNCRFHGYLPQNRERTFVVCICRQHAVAEMSWPARVPVLRLSSVIDADTEPALEDFPGRLPSSATCRRNVMAVYEKILEEGRDPLEQELVINMHGSEPHWNEGYSPCLTQARAAAGGFWLSWLQRQMTSAEVCRLQGVDMCRIPAGLATERQIRQLAGNSIPIPLLARVLQAALEAAGLV